LAENVQVNVSFYLSTSCCLVTFVTAVMYLIMIFEASVLPEPLSPKEMKMTGTVELTIAYFGSVA
jgi:hypothetical protein